MYKQDLALNNVLWLICHKTQATKKPISCNLLKTFTPRLPNMSPNLQPCYVSEIFRSTLFQQFKSVSKIKEFSASSLTNSYQYVLDMTGKYIQW